MLLDKNDVFVMAGDSVTDCGRDYNAIPAGWGSQGDGYVNLVDAFLTSMYPENKVSVINRGISGNTVVDLAARWDRDVLSFNPSWVSIMIGINDVWRQFDGELMRIDIVTPEIYRSTLEDIILKTKPVVKGMFIISPFMMDANKEQPMRKRAVEYAAISKGLADKHELIYVDVQSKIDTFMESLDEYYLSSDRVHPNYKGHAIIAKALLDAMGINWNR